jgi:hypothetical protein
MPTQFNIPLAKEVLAHIEADPDHFDMFNWYTLEDDAPYELHYDPDLLRRVFDDCGTAACIGGWALLLADQDDYDAAYDRAQDRLEDWVSDVEVEHVATELLGLECGNYFDLQTLLCSSPKTVAIARLRRVIDIEEMRRNVDPF